MSRDAKDHLPVRNLLALQQMAAIATIDRQIPKDWEAGYALDVDDLLERRKRLTDAVDEGRFA
jgi:hypothetical protein